MIKQLRNSSKYLSIIFLVSSLSFQLILITHYHRYSIHGKMSFLYSNAISDVNELDNDNSEYCTIAQFTNGFLNYIPSIISVHLNQTNEKIFSFLSFCYFNLNRSTNNLRAPPTLSFA